MTHTAKHTPGPWVGYISPDDGRHIISEAHNQDVIVCEQVHTDADMGLIAAAPAMYEALSTLVELLDERGLYPLNVDDARRALAQAEGR